WARAAVYAFGSLGLCLLALFGGITLATATLRFGGNDATRGQGEAPSCASASETDKCKEGPCTRSKGCHSRSPGERPLSTYVGSPPEPHATRGQYMITATPTTQNRAPITSGRSGRTPSTHQPHRIDSTTNTPP